MISQQLDQVMMQKGEQETILVRKLDHVTIEIVDSVDKWKKLEPEWNKIVKQSLTLSIFLSYEFLVSAWEALGEGGELHILIIRFKEALLGIAPLKISRRRFGGIRTRTIEPIATVVAERDFFVVVREEGLFYEAVVAYLAENLQLWDKISFFQLPDDHALVDKIGEGFSGGRGLIVEKKGNLVHIGVNISKSWQQYFADLDPKFRRKLLSSMRGICDAGKPQILRFGSPKSIERYLPLYVELEKRSWKARMRSGITRTGSLFRLYKMMMESCAKNGWTELTFLMINSRLIAGGIGFIFDKKYTYLQTVFDQDAKRFNPGTVLMTINVWRAFENEFKVVDFMGNYPEYKRNWGNSEWKSYNICIRKKLSGEGLAYFGARGVKAPLLWLYGNLWALRRKRAQINRLAPLEIAGEEISSENIVYGENDIKEIFFPSDEVSDDSKGEESTFCQIQPAEVERLVIERAGAREKGNWKSADAIRDYLVEKGIVVNDTRQGSIWKYSGRKGCSSALKEA